MGVNKIEGGDSEGGLLKDQTFTEFLFTQPSLRKWFASKFCCKRKSDIVILDARKTNKCDFLFCYGSRKFDIVVFGRGVGGKLTSLPNTDGSLGARRKRQKLSEAF